MSSDEERLLVKLKLLQWGFGGTVGALLIIGMAIIGWYANSVTTLQTKVDDLRNQVSSHIAAQQAQAAAFVTQAQHADLTALVYGLKATVSSDQIQIQVNTKRLDVLEEQMRRQIDGPDFMRTAPPKSGP